MMTPGAPPDQPRVRRLVGLIAGGLLTEAALMWVVRLSPALTVIMRPVYLVVAAFFALAIRHATRRRQDRRQGDRRHAPPQDRR